MAALGFLHYLVMLGSTVMLASAIVPAMGGGPVSVQILLPTACCHTLFKTNYFILTFALVADRGTRLALFNLSSL